MTKLESFKHRMAQSWGLWAIIITNFVVARFNFIMIDKISIEDLIVNNLIVSILQIGLFSIIIALRIYGDTNHK